MYAAVVSGVVFWVCIFILKSWSQSFNMKHVEADIWQHWQTMDNTKVEGFHLGLGYVSWHLGIWKKTQDLSLLSLSRKYGGERWRGGRKLYTGIWRKDSPSFGNWHHTRPRHFLLSMQQWAIASSPVQTAPTHDNPTLSACSGPFSGKQKTDR